MAETKVRGRAFLIFSWGFRVDSPTEMHTFSLAFYRVKINLKEAGMFEVTTKADEMIQEFFKGKEDKKIIRIFLSQGG
jgi:hypothetical protein